LFFPQSLPILCRTRLYIWVTQLVSYYKHELLTIRGHPLFFGKVHVAHLFSFISVILLFVFTFLYSCCDVRYDFCIIKMFNSSLPPVVLHYLCLLAHSGVQHILCCALFIFVLSTQICQFSLISIIGYPFGFL
jgi:hypothetical protein